MPTVLRIQGFKFYFYSHEPNEPPHVHVDRQDASCKVWLANVEVAVNHGFSKVELNTICGIVKDNCGLLLARWHEYFGGN
jgi:hypothetical protein